MVSGDDCGTVRIYPFSDNLWHLCDGSLPCHSYFDAREGSNCSCCWSHYCSLVWAHVLGFLPLHTCDHDACVHTRVPCSPTACGDAVHVCPLPPHIRFVCGDARIHIGQRVPSYGSVYSLWDMYTFIRLRAFCVLFHRLLCMYCTCLQSSAGTSILDDIPWPTIMPVHMPGQTDGWHPRHRT